MNHRYILFLVLICLSLSIIGQENPGQGIYIEQQNHGRGFIRLLKVYPYADHHDIVELCLRIWFDGNCPEACTDANNDRNLPTNILRNTAYGLAKQNHFKSIEEYGLLLTKYLLENHHETDCVSVEIQEKLWQHITVGTDSGTVDHPHAFRNGGSEKRTTLVVRTKEKVTITSGVENLFAVRTKGVDYDKFPKNSFFNTLKTDIIDMVLPTEIKGTWTYSGSDADFVKSRARIREALLEVFASQKSHSLYHTVYDMGKALLEKCPEIAETKLILINKNDPIYVFDLGRFGMQNENEILVASEEPYGFAEVNLTREKNNK